MPTWSASSSWALEKPAMRTRDWSSSVAPAAGSFKTSLTTRLTSCERSASSLRAFACRSVTWAISCASTAAISEVSFASARSPRVT